MNNNYLNSYQSPDVGRRSLRWPGIARAVHRPMYYALIFFIAFLSTFQAKAQYCLPPGNINGWCCNFGVSRFVCGSISNNTGTPTGLNSDGTNYFNFTAQSTIVTPGSSVPFTVDVAGGGNAQGLAIWIDWNEDGVFSNGAPEQVFINANVGSNVTVNSSFTVPTGLKPCAKRMRIIADWQGGGILTTAYTNCSQLSYGMIYEYTISVAATAGIDLALNGIVSPLLYKVGNNDLTYQMTNNAGTTINSATLGFQLGTGTPVTVNTPISPALTSCAKVSTLVTTPLNIPAAGFYQLKIWATSPNGTYPDGNTANDTLKLNICTPLNGNYTINPAGSGGNNFTTFTAAVNSLVSCGVDGKVVFTVSPGTYNEQITIPAILGASATNNITFDGGAGNAASRVLSWNALSQTSKHTLKINGAQYVNFRNLTIQSLNGSWAWPVHIKSNTANVRFVGNIIQNTGAGSASTTQNLDPITIGGTDDNNWSSPAVNIVNVDIDSNQIIGGYYGISYYGNNYSGIDLRIRKNVITNAYYSAIYIYYMNNAIIQNNVMSLRPIALAGGYALIVQQVQNQTAPYYTEISGNEISNPNQYGMYLTSLNGGAPRTKIFNNIIRGPYYSTSSWGINFSSCQNLDVWHNSVDMDYPTTNVDGSAVMFNGCSGIDVRNNIFSVNSTASIAVPFFAYNSSYFTSLDYNTYYKPVQGASLLIFNHTTPQTIINSSNLQGGMVATFNNNSNTTTPNYISKTNMRLNAFTLAPFGTGGLAATDIDGRTRCSTYPSLGASESPYVLGINPGIVIKDTVYINSPLTIYNTSGPKDPKVHLWSIDNGAATFTSTHVNYTFTTPGKHKISLKTTGCSGTDSTVKEVFVATPTEPPVAAFLSEANEGDQGYPVKFTDLSSGGPTSWTWSVTPAVNVSFLPGPGAQHPQIVFGNTGTYEVCLAVANVAGPGKKVCRSQYIKINEATSLCGTKTVSRATKGKIFDSGGKNGNYKDNENCSFLIDPCASSVTLKFNSFNMSQGDVVRIYDGRDALGVPLHSGNGLTGLALPGSFTATSGKMFVQIVSNATTNSAGFEAEWTSIAKAFNKPIATFKAPDTLYTGTKFTFLSTSTAIEPEITWDFNNDGAPDATGVSPSYTFATPGSFIIKLSIQDCGGLDGAAKFITVVNPSKAPTSDFISNYTTISAGESVNLLDRSTQAPTKWKWDITPKNYTYISATDSLSQNPKVMFNKIGNYNVTLTSENGFGTGTTTKTAYIKVVDFCFPGAGLNSDIGITRVAFSGIDNVSLIGPSTYTNYSQTIQPAAVQKGTTYDITVERATKHEMMSINVWIDYNGDGIFATNEIVASDAPDTVLKWKDQITIPLTANEGQYRMRIGTSYGLNKNQSCGMNIFGEFEDYTVTIYSNLIRPVITVKGPSKITAELGRLTSYLDSGATAFDDLDGDITAKVIATNNLNLTAPGTYFYKYNVSDLTGNSAEEKSREITITPDTTPPTLVLSGTNPFNVVYGTLYSEPGATATDLVDGNIPASKITISGGPVNPFLIGKYTLTYSVLDVAGNLTSIKRDVIVGDTGAPEIILKGADTITIPLLANFVDPGALVVDNFNKGLSYTVNLGIIDNTTVGDYQLVYNAMDSSGNSAKPRYRTVMVRDMTAPELVLIGDTVRMEVFSTFVDPGYTVSDNYDPKDSVTVTIQGTVNNKETGNNFLIYTATDKGGNSTPILVRIVKVMDSDAPVIHLTGRQFVNICRWETFVDSGATVTDNYDKGLEIVSSGTVNNTVEGVYSITYSTKDLSGNKALDVQRFVNVTPPCHAGIANADQTSVNVYPNPSDGIVNISIKGRSINQLSIEVKDVLGRIISLPVHVDAHNGAATLDMSSVSNGMYFITVIADNEVSTHKIKIVK